MWYLNVPGQNFCIIRKLFSEMALWKYQDFVTIEISLWESDKSVSKVLQNFNIAFWFVKKFSIQLGLWDWKHIYIYIKNSARHFFKAVIFRVLRIFKVLGVLRIFKKYRMIFPVRIGKVFLSLLYTAKSKLLSNYYIED